ncbi:MAG: peptidase M14 [candidate division Zixibacteria bacterium]|nr:peptidase M14 [candidate division Zixibacteria bacterium]
MRRSVIFWGLLFTFLILQQTALPEEEWLTYYEKSNYLETPRYNQTVEFCQRLADESDRVMFTDFGISPQGRKLPLLIIDKDGRFQPVPLAERSKPVVLIEACIHPGESDGKDAGLTLLRDMIIHKKHDELLDNVIVLFIPIFGVDGHERFGPYNRINQNGPEGMGWRVTAQNLNLNRDFLKADAPEMRAWLRLFNRWLPDFLIDCHTTNGADYQYAITYAVADRENMVKPVRNWLKKAYLPELHWKMEKSGYPTIRYIIPKDHFDITKGLMSWVAPPRFSHGYGAVQNRPFLLVETHMLKDYKTRVESTYYILLHTLEIVSKNPSVFLKALRDGDRETAEEMVGVDYALRYKIGEDSEMVDFKGVEFEVVDSDVSGGRWIKWGDNPRLYKIPFYYQAEPYAEIEIPYAYVLPPQWLEQIEIIMLHGADVKRLTEELILEVESYRFSDVEWREHPYEGRHPVKFEVEKIIERRTFPQGSAVVKCNQRTSRVIAQLLEPQGYDSFVSWGFFDTIFEQKEYAEDYVMEEMARQMMQDNPALKEEFEQKLESDSSFAASPHDRLDFFYRHSPYWDDRINIYPVGKLMSEMDLPLR